MINTNGDFVYTELVDTSKSSAVASLIYNAESKKLLMELWSGILVGYDAVSADVWTALKAEYEDPNGSLGRYWNKWIKPYFTGFDTSEIVDFVLLDEAGNEVEVEDNSKSEDVTPGSTGELSVGRTVVVFYEIDDDGPFEQVLTLEDDINIVDAFQAVMDQAGVKNAKPTSVLLFLE